VDDGVARTGKVPTPRHDGGRVESGAARRQGGQAGEVLEDEDAVAEQARVRGTALVREEVHGHRVESHDRWAALGQPVGPIRHEERGVCGVFGCAPVTVATGVEQHGSVPDVGVPERDREQACVHGPAAQRVHDQNRQVGHRRQREAGEVGTVGEPVEGAVQGAFEAGSRVPRPLIALRRRPKSSPPERASQGANW
jgi:hypothetical protein